MAIKINNSLTTQKEEFVPIKRGQVSMYVCGPTVYDISHIGHMRSAYIFDVIRRYFTYRGFKVTFVRNITDIDDKIINRARENSADAARVGKEADLNEQVRCIARKYTLFYEQDMENMGIKAPDIQPKATEHIPDMIAMIQALIKKGIAYEADGDVYFEVRKFPAYGKLSHQSIDQMDSGARIEPGKHKKDPLDFALWKRVKAGEPAWDSPWGKGRPGWHIECSVMSTKYLQSSFDIHGGGRDLIFPHHENEIAQAEAATGKPFARYWIHNGLLTINGQKMAKSLGNFVTMKDFIEKYKDADLLKLFFLSAHYSHPIDFSFKKIEEVKKQKKIFYDFFDRVDFKEQTEQTVESTKDIKKIDEMCAKFEQAMDDDFNMPKGLAALFELVDFGSKLASSDKESALEYADEKLTCFFNIFGLNRKQNKDIPKGIRSKARERYLARKNKDFKKADKLRNEIEAQIPYALADTANAFTFIAKHLPEEQ